jgi:hypothetical protein
MQSKFAILIAATASLSALGAASASASAVYTYTGNPFTAVISPYTTSDSVTASIVLSAALSDNLSFANVAPTSFTMSDGVQTINTANVFSSIFQISTDSSGKIVAWDIVSEGLNGEIISDLKVPSTDEGFLIGPGSTFLALGRNQGNPGTWAGPNQPIVTPLPAALPLFATGLAMTGLLGWRKKRKAAAAIAAA